MIVNLKSIDRVPRRFDLFFNTKWWEFQDDDSAVVGFDGDINCQINIARTGTKHVLDGHVTGSVIFRCDRCLETYQQKMDLDFRIFLSSPPNEFENEDELELCEDDMAVHFTRGTEIDLDDIVRGQIYLSLPIKSLCRDDCAGLCSRCGANLNLGECGCKKSEGHPEFAKLKALKIKG